MPPSSTHTSLPHPPSPAGDPHTPGSDHDDSDDQLNTDPGVWKRRYLVLQERVNAQRPSKRKAE